ncbi:protein-export chaperone SecB [Uliginosibacterium gangwonense]|uniref:protein-export chaperone SecB n=1 Tax=Uliginosibacterium gangwonense TaxID=392736 RepID=UPI0003664E18|nr:protein-export chaperone SecB [Uliginosibacterium gangwonense]
MEQNEQPVFNIEKLYIKDLSLEVPNAPAIFLEQEAPTVGIELGTTATQVGDGFYEVALTVTVNAKIGEDKVAFLVEAVQAGIFQIRNIPEGDIEPVLMIGCANILFPYARETISDAVARGGMHMAPLAPVNFEGLYAARQQELAQQQGGADVPVQ